VPDLMRSASAFSTDDPPSEGRSQRASCAGGAAYRILDPRANGSYDWWDINLGGCLRYWGALNIAVLGAAAVIVYALGHRGGTKPLRTEVNA
jgi:hypothetical protein